MFAHFFSYNFNIQLLIKLITGESDSENGNDLSDDMSVLPPANIGNVDAILDTIMENNTPVKRDRFVLSVIKEVCDGCGFYTY